MSGEKQKYGPKGFTVVAGRSRLYGLSPQAKVTCEDLQMSLTRRRMSAGLSSCVECRVGSMAPPCSSDKSCGTSAGEEICAG
jgi:hypothetical protein